MTAASLARVGGDRKGIEFPHVLAGAAFDGPAAALARALDKALLEEAGWDPRSRILYLPAGHRLLGRKVRVESSRHCDRPLQLPGHLPSMFHQADPHGHDHARHRPRESSRRARAGAALRGP